MFERRLKIFLALLSVIVLLLMARGASVQLFGREYWKEQANDAMKRTHLVETSRGKILDRMGRTLAVDVPCIDACVDYRAIEMPLNESWVRDRALERLHAQLGDPYAHASKHDRKEMLDAEIEAVKSDVQNMWVKLAKVSDRTVDEIEETRDSIARRVQARRRYVWLHNYLRALKKKDAGKTDAEPGWKKWLINGGSSDGTPDLDKFHVTVAEELEHHVILPAIETDVQNELGKHIDRYPGLELRPGTNRSYPYGDVACHLLGQITRVSSEDLKDDADSPEHDELRDYLPNDLIGRTGAEALCEPLLRGSRGRYEKVLGDERVVSSTEPVPGRDVKLSIDIELQQEIQTAFSDARLRNADGQVEETTVLHGAAIVIDVKTGEVRAMVSYPTYDQNKLEKLYSTLRDDDINNPLMNRATMAQLEPGSTVKPMVGLAAVTEGLLKIDEGIECTGFLVLGGKKYPIGRCWVASKFFAQLGGKVAHHPVPWDAPHPTGFLTFGDGLERSCNVFFETTADRLGFDRLSDWFGRFGLGRPTGIGIAEAKGRVPSYYSGLPAVRRRAAAWFAGIGQGYVKATPIQMANVAATIARKGVWMRPTLLSRETRDQLGAEAPPSDTKAAPDVVDLHIPPDAIAAAWDGMNRVVNGKAGTGKGLVKGDDLLANAGIDGKTGTAQASPFRAKVRDANGHVVKDENGKDERFYLTPSTPTAPNLQALWYRGGGVDGKELDHAWYMGFAPSDHPQIAFVAMVEYGGSGGVAAASVAREALEACIAHHYLQLKPQTASSGN